MSSNNIHSLRTNISQDALVDELNSLIKSNKTIIPFNKKQFLCNALSTAEDIVYLDLADYGAVEEYSSQDQIITVQTGIKIKNLQNLLLKEGRWFPVAYYDDETSLLDLILSAEIGPLEQLFGGLRRHILGLDSILGTGQLIKSGGKVVKNVSGYDLTRFFIGSYGYFALPIKAHLRLYVRPPQNLTLVIQSDDWKQLVELAKQMSKSNLDLAYMDLLNIELAKISILEERYKLEKQFALIFRVNGDEATLNIATETLKNILRKSKFHYSIISEFYEQENLLQELTQISWFTNRIPFPKNQKARILDLAVNSFDLSQLLSDSKILSVPFNYRIISNRLRFCLHSLKEQNELLDYLTTFATNNRMILPSAYGDDSYIRRVNNLGYDTNNGDQLVTIKKQLKIQFDPHNLFNPYVEL